MGLYIFLIINMFLSAVFFKSIFSKKNLKLIYLIYNMSIFAFLAMFRSTHIGNDTREYISLFYSILQSNDVLNFWPRYEVGYLYLNKVLGFISTNHQILLIVISIYIYVVITRFIYKYSELSWISVVLFFSLGYFDLSLSGTRHMLAIATILIAYDFIIKKRPLKFIITVSIAILFHNAAFIFLFAYPVSKLKLSKKLITCTALIGIILFIFLNKIINIAIIYFPNYAPYVNEAESAGEIKISTVLSMLITIIILVSGRVLNRNYIVKNRLTHNKSKINPYEIQSIFLLIAITIMFIAIRVDIISRISEFYSIFAIIYLPNAIKNVSNKHIKVIVVFYVIVLFISYITSIQLLRPEWQSTYPFEFFWYN